MSAGFWRSARQTQLTAKLAQNEDQENTDLQGEMNARRVNRIHMRQRELLGSSGMNMQGWGWGDLKK
ncbi:hypothetical protein ASD52_34135 [Ensifer sp. Root142]|nr:hypothetical protein ASD52_34135 [Ensifer sp. Root142]